MKTVQADLPNVPRLPGPDPYADFAPGALLAVALKIKEGKPVTDGELALALRHLQGQPLPAPIYDYLLRRLERRMPRGRPKGGNAVELRNMMAVELYERYLAWLQKRYVSGRVPAFSSLEKASWWVGPPHERAAKMVVRWIQRARLPLCDWRNVRNLASSEK